MPIIKRKNIGTTKTELIQKINDFNLTVLITLCQSVTDSTDDKFIGNHATIQAINLFISYLLSDNVSNPPFDPDKVNLDNAGIADDLNNRSTNHEDYDPVKPFFKLCQHLLPQGPQGGDGEKWGTATLLRPNERPIMLNFFEFCSLKHVVDAHYEFVINSIKNINPTEHYRLNEAGSFQEKEATTVIPVVNRDHMLELAETLQAQLNADETTLLNTLLNNDSAENIKLKTAVDLFQNNKGTMTNVPVAEGQSLFKIALNSPLNLIKNFTQNKPILEKIKTVVATSRAFFIAVNTLLTFVKAEQDADIPHLMMWYIPFLAQGSNVEAKCLETTLLDAAKTETVTFAEKVKNIQLISGEAADVIASNHPYVLHIHSIIDYFKQQFQQLKSNMCDQNNVGHVANYDLDDFDIIQDDMLIPITELLSQESNEDGIRQQAIMEANEIEFGTEDQSNLLTQDITPMKIGVKQDTLRKLQAVENAYVQNQNTQLRRDKLSNPNTFSAFFTHFTLAITTHESYKIATTNDMSL